MSSRAHCTWNARPKVNAEEHCIADCKEGCFGMSMFHLCSLWVFHSQSVYTIITISKCLLLLTVYLSKILRVVYLAFCGWVSILASLHLAIAGEPCVGHLGIDGVVLPWHSRHRLDQPVEALVLLARGKTQCHQKPCAARIKPLPH